MSSASLTGRQKAATMIAQFGTDHAAKVLREMSDVEVVELMSEVAQLPPLDFDTVREVVEEFVHSIQALRAVGQGGIDAARKVLRERLGSARAEELLSRFLGPSGNGPLAFLNSISPPQAANFLATEHPQTIAIVVAHLTSDNAAQVLSSLDEKLRAEVASRMGRLSRVSPEVVRQTGAVLERKLSSYLEGGTSTQTGGVQSLVNVLNHSDRQVEKQILTGLDELDPELAEEVRSKLFTFEDIVSLDDKALQLVLRNVAAKDLAVALKGVPEPVKSKFLKNMSARAVADLEEEIEVLGPTRMSIVEGAQAEIVRVVRDLESAGEITIGRETDELVE